MKKVKIVVTALTICAVVGGALAFKTTKQVFCKTSSGTCDITYDSATTIDPNNGRGTWAQNVYCTLSGTNCNSQTTVYKLGSN